MFSHQPLRAKYDNIIERSARSILWDNGKEQLEPFRVGNKLFQRHIWKHSEEKISIFWLAPEEQTQTISPIQATEHRQEQIVERQIQAVQLQKTEMLSSVAENLKTLSNSISQLAEQICEEPIQRLHHPEITGGWIPRKEETHRYDVAEKKIIVEQIKAPRHVHVEEEKTKISIEPVGKKTKVIGGKKKEEYPAVPQIEKKQDLIRQKVPLIRIEDFDEKNTSPFKEIFRPPISSLPRPQIKHPPTVTSVKPVIPVASFSTPTELFPKVVERLEIREKVAVVTGHDETAKMPQTKELEEKKTSQLEGHEERAKVTWINSDEEIKEPHVGELYDKPKLYHTKEFDKSANVFHITEVQERGKISALKEPHERTKVPKLKELEVSTKVPQPEELEERAEVAQMKTAEVTAKVPQPKELEEGAEIAQVKPTEGTAKVPQPKQLEGAEIAQVKSTEGTAKVPQPKELEEGAEIAQMKSPEETAKVPQHKQRDERETLPQISLEEAINEPFSDISDMTILVTKETDQMEEAFSWIKRIPEGPYVIEGKTDEIFQAGAVEKVEPLIQILKPDKTPISTQRPHPILEAASAAKVSETQIEAPVSIEVGDIKRRDIEQHPEKYKIPTKAIDHFQSLNSLISYDQPLDLRSRMQLLQTKAVITNTRLDRFTCGRWIPGLPGHEDQTYPPFYYGEVYANAAELENEQKDEGEAVPPIDDHESPNIDYNKMFQNQETSAQELQKNTADTKTWTLVHRNTAFPAAQAVHMEAVSGSEMHQYFIYQPRYDLV